MTPYARRAHALQHFYARLGFGAEGREILYKKDCLKLDSGFRRNDEENRDRRNDDEKSSNRHVVDEARGAEPCGGEYPHRFHG